MSSVVSMPKPDPLSTLSPVEMNVAKLVRQGHKNVEIAQALAVNDVNVVVGHLNAIFEKLGVTDRLELALYMVHHSG